MDYFYFQVAYRLNSSFNFATVPHCRHIVRGALNCKISGLLAYTEYETRITVSNQKESTATVRVFRTKTGGMLYFIEFPFAMDSWQSS